MERFPGLATRSMTGLIVEFIDTNLLVYAQDQTAGERHRKAVDLIAHLATNGHGAISTQVLIEFYSVATRKLKMLSEEVEEVIRDLSSWKFHRPGLADVVNAIHLQRRHKLAWWDAMILNSALELNAQTLWTEDFNDGQKFGSLTVRNPF